MPPRAPTCPRWPRPPWRAGRAGRALEDIIPVGLTGLRTMLERFLAVGFSKFIVRPMAPPDEWRPVLEHLAAAVGDLQT